MDSVLLATGLCWEQDQEGNLGHLRCQMPGEPSDDSCWQGVGHMGLELRVKSELLCQLEVEPVRRHHLHLDSWEWALPV